MLDEITASGRDGGTDCRQLRWTLRCQQCSRSHRSKTHGLEKFIRIMQSPNLLDFPDVDFVKPHGFQAATEFRMIAEAEERWTGRQRNVHLAIGAHGVEYEGESNRPFRRRPHRGGESTARTQHAIRLRHGSVGVRQVQQSVRHHRCIDASIRQVEGFDIPLQQFDVRMADTAKRDHGFGEINRHHTGTSFAGGCRHIPRPTGEIDQARALAAADGIEQGNDRLVWIPEILAA